MTAPTAEQLRIVAALGDVIRTIVPGAMIILPTPAPEPAPEDPPPEEKPRPDIPKLLQASIDRLVALARRCFTVIDAETMPDGTPLAQIFYEQQPADERDWIGELENELAEGFRGASNDGYQFILVSKTQPIEYRQMPDGAIRLQAAFGVLKDDPRPKEAEQQPAEESK